MEGAVGPDGCISPALLTSKLRCVRKNFSHSIHSLEFSATLNQMLRYASYLIYFSGAAQCSRPPLPFLAPCPSLGPLMLPIIPSTLWAE